MSKIERVVKIREFINNEIIYGVYDVYFKGEQKIFIRNGDSVGTVSFLWGKTASECVLEIRSDVKKEFLEFLNEAKFSRDWTSSDKKIYN
jgi:hypothetical protein